MQQNKRVLSVSEFCATYNVGKTTAYVEIAAGRLRALKCGKRTLIDVDDAETWLAALPSSSMDPRA